MPAASYSFSVGSMHCTVLSDGYFSYPTPWFFPNTDEVTLFRALEAHRMPGARILSPYNCLLIETGRHVVLVDTGAGGGSPASGAIVSRLQAVGIRPKDVDTVILTHAHADHIGGTVNGAGRPAFPDARHVLAESEWNLWTANRVDLGGLRVPVEVRDSLQAMARKCLNALRHHIEPIDRETEVAPGVRVIPAPGHTPGHLAVLLSSDGQHLLNIGDAAVHPLHLEQPEWENGFDLATATAISTRRELMERAVSEGMHLMAFHFPFPSVGRVAARAEGGWTWIPGW